MGITYKPETRKGPIILVPDLGAGPGNAPTITLEDGTVLTAEPADKHGGTFKGENGYQWVFPRSVIGQKNATLAYNGKSQVLANTNSAYRTNDNEVGSLQPSSKGAIGSGGNLGTTGNTGGFGTAGVGQYGVAPQFIGGAFPSPVLAPNPTDTYNFIDPIKFAETYSPFIRNEQTKNFEQAGQQALGAINTELQALQSYVPKSAQLKRETTAADNLFNQQQRTAQLQTGAPGLIEDLGSIAADARKYASGEAPNAVIDRALELGTRSASADVASSSGFGVRSSAARKLSDLQSARERIGLSQYGEQLLSQNVSQRNELLLAPTEYSNAGQQISVTPSVSGSQIQLGQAGELNQQTLVSGTNAFGQQIQQSQYVQSLQTNVDQFNANNQNNFALSYFNYLNSYVNSLAGAGQTSVNTGLSLDQQAAAQNLAAQEQHETQGNNAISGGLQAAGTVIGAVIGAFSDERLKDNIKEYLSGLNDILKLRPVTYTYKPKTIASDGEIKHVGVIAQEARKVFPAIVSEHDSGYLFLRPNELIFALIGAVQELSNRIVLLEAKHGIS